MPHLYNIYMKHTIVVLGGSGFLGLDLCNKLKSQYGFDVVVFSRSLGCDLSTNVGQQKLQDYLLTNESCNDIVMMAAKLGAKLFDINPFDPFIENASIDYKTYNTLMSIDRKFHVTYYSTSEVYGNVNPDNDNKFNALPSIDPSYPRSLYAQEKLIVETMMNYALSNNLLSSLRIFRPFNVSGYRQKRGVIFDMVKSAMNNKTIWYAANQSREISFLDDATSIAAKFIVDRTNGTFNLTSKNHIMLKDLAYCVKVAYEKLYPNDGCIDMKEMPYFDTYMKHRGTVSLMSTKNELDAFASQLIDHNVISGIVETLKTMK